MMEDFVELLKKKYKQQGGPKEDEKMSAKAQMAKEISDILGDDLVDGIENSKKVTVASNTSEGLKKGLKKAEEVLKSSKMDESEMDEYKMDESEMDEETELQIAELERKLEKLKAKVT